MKYYVVSDIHGFFTYFKKALTAAGFFEDTAPHKLIICGDLFDRGQEAVELQEFILDLIDKDEVILIRGNHEDLFAELINKSYGIPFDQYLHNGTYNTALQLTGYQKMDAYYNRTDFVLKCMESPFYRKILPKTIDYFETEHYIFVHGWIPTIGNTVDGFVPVEYLENWRNASKEEWNEARWENGMAASLKAKEPGKTIVCGHWHCSYGHCNIDFTCTSEFGKDAVYTPFYGDGVIAIDACTALSKIVNCIVIDD